MVCAWYLDEEKVAEDQRNAARGSSVSLETLKKLGVEYFQIDANSYEKCKNYSQLKAKRGYDYSDMLTISKDTLPDYDKKIKMFFKEHLHTDEEIRFILDGGGYFDVRDSNDKWIRIECKKSDLIVLPAGIYHRFTLDKQDYIKVIRLFRGEPVWTPHNRPVDDMLQRKEYVQKFLLSSC